MAAVKCDGAGCCTVLQPGNIRYMLGLDLCGPCGKAQTDRGQGTLLRMKGRCFATYRHTSCAKGLQAFSMFQCDLCGECITGTDHYGYGFDICEECFDVNLENYVERWAASFINISSSRKYNCEGCQKEVGLYHVQDFFACPSCATNPEAAQCFIRPLPCAIIPGCPSYLPTQLDCDVVCDICLKLIPRYKQVMVINYLLCGDCKTQPTAYVETHFRGLFKRSVSVLEVQPDASDMFVTLPVPLGAGAFGSVVKVQSAYCSQQYAMKCISLQDISEREAKRVCTELELSLSIKHPNIVEGIESFGTPDQRYMVMELADCSLQQWVRASRTRRCAQSIWRVLHQVTAGVCFLHQLNVIHRDIKPANVLVFNKIGIQPLRFKLGDLGLARQISHNTLAATNCGTPMYVAPELFRDASAASTCSDMWSVGVMLYELLFDKNPFWTDDSTGPVAAYERMRAESYSCPPGADSSLWFVVQGLLKFHPRQRFTAAELLKLCKERRTLELKLCSLSLVS